MRIGAGPDLLVPNRISGLYSSANLSERLEKPIARLSSGLKVASASDDASSLAISARLSSEVAALSQGTSNGSRTVSALQIADGAMAQMNDILTRMRVLTVSASASNLDDFERSLLNAEFVALREELSRISLDTRFAGKQILGNTENPPIPFDVFGLVPRIPTNPLANLTDPNQNNNGIADEQEFVELVFEYRSTENVTGLSYQNARIVGSAVGAEDGDVVDGTTIPFIGSNIDPTDGFFANNGDPLPDATAGVLVQVTGVDDLDVVFRDGTNGQEFDVQLDFTYTPASTGVSATVQITFGTATVGGIIYGTGIPLQRVEVLGSCDGDRDVSARIGSGILPDEDELTAIIPDVTIDNLNFSLPNAQIDTQENATVAFGIVRDAQDYLIESRSTVGALLSKAQGAVANQTQTVELQDAARARLVAADVAKEVTNLSNGEVQLATTTAVVSQFIDGNRTNSQRLIDIIAASS